MLSPLVYVKVVCARNAYLKAYKKQDWPAFRENERHFFDVMERYEFYNSEAEARPNDAKRILKIATTKKNATEEEKTVLNAMRRKIDPLAEPAYITCKPAACPPQA